MPMKRPKGKELIDDYLIYNRELSSTEVSTLVGRGMRCTKTKLNYAYSLKIR
jgi:hypothetical protein